MGCVREVVGSCAGMGRSRQKWCSADCGLLSDGLGPICGLASCFYVHMDVATTHITTTTHSSSCFQAEQFIMSSSDKKSSGSPEQKPSSKEQQTSPSGAKYEGVVRHPALSTYFVHKDILRDLLAKNSEKWAPYPEAEFQFSSLT